jgi:hypothetical protein
MFDSSTLLFTFCFKQSAKVKCMTSVTSKKMGCYYFYCNELHSYLLSLQSATILMSTYYAPGTLLVPEDKVVRHGP